MKAGVQEAACRVAAEKEKCQGRWVSYKSVLPWSVAIAHFAFADTMSRAELDAEHTQKVLEMEHTQQLKLKERQKFFEEAFQQDMEQYLSAGYLQIAERREPMGSMSSMEVNIDLLEQMDLMDVSDQEALDVFLNSGGEDNTVLSPVLGPELSIGQSEVTLQVPDPSEFRAKLPTLSSASPDPATQDPSEGGESPVVQSDEEGVEVDTALATLHTDDSDS
uniref:Dystrobrevin binding protein 1 n=1 Tax=Equus caballus TaxID=9796 RepID=A0A9L0R753_HORSE